MFGAVGDQQNPKYRVGPQQMLSMGCFYHLPKGLHSIRLPTCSIDALALASPGAGWVHERWDSSTACWRLSLGPSGVLEGEGQP